MNSWDYNDSNCNEQPRSDWGHGSRKATNAHKY